MRTTAGLPQAVVCARVFRLDCARSLTPQRTLYRRFTGSLAPQCTLDRKFTGSHLERDVARFSPRLTLHRLHASPLGTSSVSSAHALRKVGVSAALDSSVENEPSATSSSSPSGGTEQPHLPVLLAEILGFFSERKVQVYVDGTLGAGGHASAILSAHPEMKKFIGFDVDPLAHQLARPRLEACSSEGTSIHLLRKNFREMTSALQELSPGLEAGGVDAMLIDFGVSSMQLDTAERGFSFLADGPVDMRMDPTASLRAEQIVNMWSASEIGRILRDYGEEVHWKGIAQRIVERRPIHTTSELVRAIGGKRGGGGKGKKKPIHPATRTFQAIRIAVNDELGAIEQVIPAAIACLKPGGRLAVISFHSLEDRLVKQAFREAAGMKTSGDTFGYMPVQYLGPAEPTPEPWVKILTKKPVISSDEENQ
eukprot:CAMPEP_0198219680 /NCGR_PEP_ID=MMETSP1445-20131203/75657_1 /TAXON_ID=36898 /ORGANISM="Pyramimonas sp., Strain CCMP2087" /LENGTH=423 /DNA_ID=CAMNT_0043897189 /DNA_START=151 /DNA_END=1419 /DNA_ORIENTATION=+